MQDLTVEALTEYNGLIYASSMHRNGLYIYDTETSETRCVGMFSDVDRYERRIHCAADSFGGNVVFFPDRAKGVHIVVPQTLEMDYIPIVADEDSRFVNAVVVGDNAFCIQVRPSSKVLVLNLKTWKQRALFIPGMPDNTFFQKDYHLENKQLYLIDKRNEIIVKIDCERLIAEIEWVFPPNDKNVGFGTISKIEDNFIFTNQKEIVIWNRKTKNMRSITEFPSGYGMTYRAVDKNVRRVTGFLDVNANGEFPFSTSICNQKGIYLLPNRTNMCMLLNKESFSLSEAYLDGEEETEESLLRVNRVTHEHYLYRGAVDNPFFCSTCTGRLYKVESFENGKWISLTDNLLQWNQVYGDNLFYEDTYDIKSFIGEVAGI